MRGLFGLGVASLLALSLASGCGKPQALCGAPPVMARHDTFAYKPVEKPAPPAPVVKPAPLPLPEPPRAEPALPPHDADWEVAGRPNPWRWVVVHHSATDTGSAAAFDAYHRNGRHWDELGYHFVIGNGTGSGDGQVEVGSRWPKQKHGAHCRVGDNQEYNDFGIGICLVGNFERRRPTEAQLAALSRLVAYLAAEYRVDGRHVIGHGTVGDTRCPGRLFPFNDFVARVNAALAPRQAFASAAAE